MITAEMTEDDIMDYLMTSEFNEGLNDKEAQFLLLKFRQYYRYQVSKNSQLNHKYDDLSIGSKAEILLLQSQLLVANNELLAAQIKNKQELEKELTFAERFFGKLKRN